MTYLSSFLILKFFLECCHYDADGPSPDPSFSKPVLSNDNRPTSIAASKGAHVIATSKASPSPPKKQIIDFVDLQPQEESITSMYPIQPGNFSFSN